MRMSNGELARAITADQITSRILERQYEESLSNHTFLAVSVFPEKNGSTSIGHIEENIHSCLCMCFCSLKG